MSNLKAKINATSLDLSTFVVTTLVQGLKAEGIPISFDLNKKNDEKAAILGLEMLITDKSDNSQTPVYGEIAICDFITQIHNQSKPASQHALRLGSDLNFDNYV